MDFSFFLFLVNMTAEYGLGGGVSTKGNVYSFGIIVLEMFTRRKPTQEMFNGELRWCLFFLLNVEYNFF